MTKINFKNNKTKTATTILGALVIGLIISSPITALPMVGAQQGNGNPQILNRVAPSGTMNGTKIILPTPNFPLQHKVIPPGPARSIGVNSIADQKVCGAPFGIRSDQVQCFTISRNDAASTWAEGTTFYPQGSGYSSYNGIGASPQIISLGSTSSSASVTREVVSLNLVDSGGHIWGLQNTVSWGTQSFCGSSGYEESIWLNDITGNMYYSAYACLASIVGNQYNLQIYYNTSTSQWNFVTADGSTYSITAITGAPSGDITAVDGVTTAHAENQFPILLESTDTTSTDFNNFEIDMYGSEIKYNGSWILAGNGCCTVNIPGYSYYSGTATDYSSSQHWGTLVGGVLNAPTTVGYEGNAENSVYGPGINISKSGYDNYWYCPQCGGTYAVQPTSPGTGYLPYAGYDLW